MKLDDNPEMVAMLEHAKGSLENKIRQAYNSGYSDGFKAGVFEAWDDMREQLNKSLRQQIEQTEPQTNADQHVQRVEYVGNDEKSRCWTCKHFERMHETPIASGGNYYTYVVCTARECHYEPKTELQYDAEEVAKDINRRVDMVKKEWNARHIADEPQTDCSWK